MLSILSKPTLFVTRVHVDDAVGPIRRIRSVGDDDGGHVAQMVIESIEQTLFGELVER